MKNLAFAPAALLLCGCAFVTPHPTPMTLTPQAMEIVGTARGESSNYRLLCVIPVSSSNASLAAATERAVNSVSAEAIVNPMVDDERGFGLLGLWCWQKIRVYGTAVRFKRNQPYAQPAAKAAAPAQQGGAQRTAVPAAPASEPMPGAEEGESINDMEKRLFKK